MNIPGSIFAGDQVSWNDNPTTDNLGNPIDSLWVLTYALRQNTVAASIVATASGTGWLSTFLSSVSSTFSAGTVYWQAYATKSGTRVTLGSGQIEIKASIADAPGGTFSNLSQDEQDLIAVEAAIRANISGGAVAEYTIAGRSLRKVPIESLIAWQSQLRARVVRQKKRDSIANGLGNPSKLKVRF